MEISFGDYSDIFIVQNSSGNGTLSYGKIRFALVQNFNQLIVLPAAINTVLIKISLTATIPAGTAVNINFSLSV